MQTTNHPALRWLLFLSISASFNTAITAQTTYRVTNRETGEPLPFVNVQVEGEHRGVTTDLDGYFTPPATNSGQRLIFSNVGFNPRTIPADSLPLLRKHRLEMSPTTYQLSEVVVNATENPALRIIRKVVENRDRNNPEKYANFSFTSYNKFYFTSSLDTVGQRAKLMAKQPMTKKDSAKLEELNFLAKTNFFLVETVNKREFQYPSRNKEEVIASKVSGLKGQPLFALIASQLQSLSFYYSVIPLFQTTYLNPVSPSGIKSYFFLIEDTVLTQAGDTTYVISFRPHKNRTFSAMKGVLQISTNGYAIKNVIAEPDEPSRFVDTLKLSLKIQQAYERVGGKWFPTQLSSELWFFSNSKKGGQKVAPIIGIGRSYLSNIKVDDPNIRVAAMAPALSFSPKADEQDEEFWNHYRQERLTEKDRNTYHLLDSISRKVKLDKKMRTVMALAMGYIPAGPLELPLNRLINYNQHERLRLGLGVNTGSRISKVIKLGGYGAYGFGDSTAKYGGFMQVNLNRTYRWSATAGYSSDVAESGAILPSEKGSIFSSEALYPFFYDEMDNVKKWNLETTISPLRYLTVTLDGSMQNIAPTTSYQYVANNGKLLNTYKVTSASVELRYAYGEELLQLPDRTLPQGTTAPVVRLKFERGVDVLHGQLAYNKVLFRVDYSHNMPLLGIFSVSASAGKVWEAAPLGLLFNAHGSNYRDAKPKTWSVEVASSFTTVYPGEFYSERFAYLFLRHSFRNLIVKTKYFSPQIMVAANLGYGDLSHKDRHVGYPFRTMNRGLYEVGFGVENLFDPVLHLYQKVLGGSTNYIQSIGFSLFYRMGPYSYLKQSSNLFFRVSAGINI